MLSKYRFPLNCTSPDQSDLLRKINQSAWPTEPRACGVIERSKRQAASNAVPDSVWRGLIPELLWRNLANDQAALRPRRHQHANLGDTAQTPSRACSASCVHDQVELGFRNRFHSYVTARFECCRTTSKYRLQSGLRTISRNLLASALMTLTRRVTPDQRTLLSACVQSSIQGDGNDEANIRWRYLFVAGDVSRGGPFADSSSRGRR
jgi:hypothetical protein